MLPPLVTYLIAGFAGASTRYASSSVQLPRRAMVTAYASNMIDATEEFGIDPRDAAEKPIAADSQWASSLISGKINSGLGSVEQLQAAVDVANEADKLVVVKFERDGCKACAATKGNYTAAAEEHESSGIFFTVNFNEFKALCKQAKLKSVPIVHIYGQNGLVHTGQLGPKKWDEFKEKLDKLVKE